MFSQILPAVLALGYLGTINAVPAASFFQDDSAIASLFQKRAANPDDPNFASAYPTGWVTPPASSLPKAWTDKLASIQMPNVGVSNPNNGYPSYPNNESGADQTICSFTYECTTSDDLVNPPDGVIAISFDDGPTDQSPALNAFLAQNNISTKATHFMIGGNVLGDPKGMQATFNAGGHIAVHTWSHPYMTTLSNEGVLAELGWTMQIISDLNGGRIPKFWRPPYGDVDNRVRAIAKGVFGLETVPWNQDSGDWAISTGTYTSDQVNGEMTGWIKGSKSPGLLILEHETHDTTVSVFETAYPQMISNGWTVKTVADAFNMDWYLNAGTGNQGTVTSMAVAGSFAAASSNSSTSAPSTSANATSAATSTSASAQSQSGSVSASTTPAASGAVTAGSSVASASTSSTGGAKQGLLVSGWLLTLVGLTSAAFL